MIHSLTDMVGWLSSRWRRDLACCDRRSWMQSWQLKLTFESVLWECSSPFSRSSQLQAAHAKQLRQPWVTSSCLASWLRHVCSLTILKLLLKLLMLFRHVQTCSDYIYSLFRDHKTLVVWCCLKIDWEQVSEGVQTCLRSGNWACRVGRQFRAELIEAVLWGKLWNGVVSNNAATCSRVLGWCQRQWGRCSDGPWGWSVSCPIYF